MHQLSPPRKQLRHEAKSHAIAPFTYHTVEQLDEASANLKPTLILVWSALNVSTGTIYAYPNVI